MSSKPAKPLWIVRRSAIHRRGVFARTDIPKGEAIIEYLGEKISKAESNRRGLALMDKSAKTGCAGVYIFTLNKKQDLDGDKSWNTARLINHSCEPNGEAFIGRGRIWIHARRDIKAGEELSFNYGFDMETWEDHPCRCGSAKCVGYILDEQYWPKLKKLLKTKEERQQRIAELEAKAQALRQELQELGDGEDSPAQKRLKDRAKSGTKTVSKSTKKKGLPSVKNTNGKPAAKTKKKTATKR